MAIVFLGHTTLLQHVAILGEIVRLELGHAVDVRLRRQRIGTLPDVAHGERRTDYQAAAADLLARAELARR